MVDAEDVQAGLGSVGKLDRATQSRPRRLGAVDANHDGRERPRAHASFVIAITSDAMMKSRTSA